jgi:hypothetical protein
MADSTRRGERSNKKPREVGEICHWKTGPNFKVVATDSLEERVLTMLAVVTRS